MFAVNDKGKCYVKDGDIFSCIEIFSGMALAPLGCQDNSIMGRCPANQFNVAVGNIDQIIVNYSRINNAGRGCQIIHYTLVTELISQLLYVVSQNPNLDDLPGWPLGISVF